MISRYKIPIQLKQLPIYRSVQAQLSSTASDIDFKSSARKVLARSLNINTRLLDDKTVQRLATCPKDFVDDLVKNLKTYGFADNQIAATLKNYDDWSVVTRRQLEDTSATFRRLSLNSDLFRSVFAGNPCIVGFDSKALAARLFDLKNFFVNKHLERVLPRSPQILTDNFDSFRYKYVYIYILMGFRQQDMSSSCVFNYGIKHIRERHLFLERAFLFDKPNKKGSSRVENPKLSAIMDTPLREFLRVCTQNRFDDEDYATFCDYLSEEFVDNELLGKKIDRPLRNQILDAVRVERRNFLQEREDDDDE